MSIPTSHNFDILGFAFHPSRFTLLSHAANLFLLKGNPYNLFFMLLLEHPQAEQQGIICYTAWKRAKWDRKWRPHPSTNQKLVRHWPNSIPRPECRLWQTRRHILPGCRREIWRQVCTYLSRKTVLSKKIKPAVDRRYFNIHVSDVHEQGSGGGAVLSVEGTVVQSHLPPFRNLALA